MNAIVTHLISGRVLYTGLGTMFVCLCIAEYSPSKIWRRWLAILAWLSALLVISTASFPVWGALALLGGGLIVWTGLRLRDSDPRLRRTALGGLAVCSLGLLSLEYSGARVGEVTPVSSRSLVVIGDSLSAGLGEGEGVPWPIQLGKQHAVQITNLAEAGATSRDGIEQARLAKRHPGLVLVELGGNDMLGGRSARDFEIDLRQVLTTLRSDQRSVVLLEFPFLPGRNAWGVIQRRLASEFGCALISKSQLVDVLAAPGSTVDTLHLSEVGHGRMGSMIWQTIGPALPPAAANSAVKPIKSPQPPVPQPPDAVAASVVTQPAPEKPAVPALDEMILFQPSRQGHWTPTDLVYQDLDFSAADGTRLHGWYCPADPPRAVVLYCHGNAGNIASIPEYLEHLRRDHRLSILAFDYRGYGKSHGLPTVEGVLSDSRAARAKLAELSGVPVAQQVIWGRSMGGAVAVQLASEVSPRGLVLESTFDSFRSVAAHHAPNWAFLVPPRRLDSVSLIAKIYCPLMQIHGTADRVVPFHMGRTLFEAAAEPKQFVPIPRADHNSPVPQEIYGMIDRFLDSLDRTSH